DRFQALGRFPVLLQRNAVCAIFVWILNEAAIATEHASQEIRTSIRPIGGAERIVNVSAVIGKRLPKRTTHTAKALHRNISLPNVAIFGPKAGSGMVNGLVVHYWRSVPL